MRNLYRMIGLLFFAYLLFFAVTTLQSLFDRGDLKRASALFFNSPLPGSEKKLSDLMAEKMAMQPDKVSCQMSLVSREQGKVFFDCSGGYSWMVNLVASRIEPVSDAARELVAPWQEKK